MSRPRVLPNEKVVSSSSARRGDSPSRLESGQDRKITTPDVNDPQRNQNQMLLVRRYGRTCWVLFVIFAVQGFLSMVHLNSNKKDQSNISRRWDFSSRTSSNSLNTNVTVLKASEGAEDLNLLNNPDERNSSDSVASILSSSLGFDERLMNLSDLLRIRRAESLNSSLRNEAVIDPTAFSSETNTSAEKAEEVPQGRRIPISLADIDRVRYNSSLPAFDQDAPQWTAGPPPCVTAAGRLPNGTCRAGPHEYHCVAAPGNPSGSAEEHRACLPANTTRAALAELCPPAAGQTRGPPPPAQWLCVDTAHPAAAAALIASRDASERLERSPRRTVIAVVLAATARGMKGPTLSNSPLFTALLPSLLATLDAGFEYWICVGFDVGDPFYDVRMNRRAAHQWLARQLAGMRSALAQRVIVRLIFHRFLNTVRKPGPVFNYVAAAAYQDGADYFYRVNDDSEFTTPWARRLVMVLLSFNPPNVGVAGPTCWEGKSSILTHDFTHRSHQVIFGAYYPPELSDWWMDDWISIVYPGSNSYRHVDVRMRHRVVKQRYQVDRSHGKLLTPIVDSSRKIYATFLDGCRNATGGRTDVLCPGLPTTVNSAMVQRVALDPAGFRDFDRSFGRPKGLRNPSPTPTPPQSKKR